MANKKFVNEAGKTAYEIMVILPSDLGEQKTKEQIEAVTELITERDGEVTHQDTWGVRNLAYHIKGYDSGYYFVLNFVLPGAKLSDLNKNLRLNTTLLRFLISTTPANYKPMVFAEDRERLGLDIELGALADIDSLFKKREDKFENSPDKRKRTAAPKKEPAEEIKPIAKEEVKEAPKKAVVKEEPVVAEQKEEVPVEKAKPTKKVSTKEAPKKEEAKAEGSEDDRLAELDRKLDELLNKDL